MTAAKTMPLPPPCGTMTVTYEFDRKVKEPVFDGYALRRFAEEVQKKDAETIRELLNLLKMAVCQNSHDMLMTGDELNRCEAVINKTGDQK